MDSASFLSFIHDNWTWALGLALSMFGLTAFASLLNQDRKDDVALWLMGAHSESRWSSSFVSLFDAVFGDRHLSVKCLIRSVAASLIAVTVIWLLMGNAGALGLRMTIEMSLPALLAVGLAVNVVADYISLLETRWLLGRMPRATLAQIGVLIVDLLISAAIIWAAIFLYLRSPLHDGEVETFAEILGVFSVFSVFFYSTFLTSVWTWAYIASTWVMRLAARLKLTFWLDVEQKPIKVLFLLLSLCVGIVTFTGSLLLSTAFRSNPDDVRIVDRTLCTLFKGPVCLHVAALSPVEKLQLEFLTLACEGGVTRECVNRAEGIWQTDAVSAAGLWRAACDGGNALGCTNLGYLHEKGIGMDPDPQTAAHFYRKGCDGGIAGGCTNLGYLHGEGIGMDPDPQTAARLYRKGCDSGDAKGCTNLGYLHGEGIGMDPDPQTAAHFYRQGCDGGNALGCTNLGYLHDEGIGMDPDPQTAAHFYRKGCDGGIAGGCTNLGYLHGEGIGMDPDPQTAARLYRKGCDSGDAKGCTNLGILHRLGIGMDPDPQTAARLYRKGCDGGIAIACDWADALEAGGEN